MRNEEAKFFYLSQEDMVEAGVLDMPRCMEVMEEVFKIVADGDYLMGGPGQNEHGVRIFFPETPKGPNMPVAGPARRFMAMVSYLGGSFNVCGEKWYGSNVANPIERNLPRSVHFVILSHPETALPLAIMDGTLLSAMRTAAIPGLGAKYLCEKDDVVVAIIGAGVINRSCLSAIAHAKKGIKMVKVFDVARDKSEALSNEMSKKLELKVYSISRLEEAIRDSDIICAATAGTQLPFIETEWLKDGSYIALPGPVASQDDFYLTSRIVADNWKMHLAWYKEAEELPLRLQGDYVPHLAIHKLVEARKIRLEDIDDLGPIVSGMIPSRIKLGKRTILVTSGLPVQDIAWGYALYQHAMKKGIGQELTLWKKPYWF